MVAIVAIAGCFKEEAFDTTIVFRPAEQLESGGDFTNLTGVVAYAFDADTTSYEVASYDDALAGILTNKKSGKINPPIATAVAYDGGIEDAISLQVQQEEVMFVAVDTKNEIYAYTNYTVGLNLATTYISIPFRTWKSSSFSQGTWWYVVPETTTDDGDE